jgi:hypothetical protein
MSDTDRRKPHNPYGHESHWARVYTRRRDRRAARALMLAGLYDLAGTRMSRSTQGHLTF